MTKRINPELSLRGKYERSPETKARNRAAATDRVMSQESIEKRIVTRRQSESYALRRRTADGSFASKKSPTYTSWDNMIQRCTNPNRVEYPNYGGRGILVCDRWRNFENFLADMGERPADLTLDRIDNDGNYEPGNCQWISRPAQALNRRRSSYYDRGPTTATCGHPERQVHCRGMCNSCYGKWRRSQATEDRVAPESDL